MTLARHRAALRALDYLRADEHRAVVVVSGALTAWLVPWSVFLARTLPTRALARHWNAAWAGLDVAEGLAALATAALAQRRDPRACVPAAGLSALLLMDAWMDVSTSAPGGSLAVAITEATVLEVPLALAAAWLALRWSSRERSPRDCGPARMAPRRPAPSGAGQNGREGQTVPPTGSDRLPGSRQCSGTAPPL